MPRLASPLTEVQISKAKPKDKPKDKQYMLADGNGLALVVTTAGRKS